MTEPAQDITIRLGAMRDAATIAVFNLRMAMETENLRLDPSTIEQGVKAIFDVPTRGKYFVAEHRGTIVGCLLVTHEWSDWRNGDMWWLQSVYVDPDVRRLGVFKAMFAHVEKLARDAGAVAIRLYHESHNERAHEAYKRLGFENTDYAMMHKAL